MSQNSRLKKLEKTTTNKTSTTNLRGPRWWLAEFTRLAEQGFFDKEPDAPLALQLYRAAVERNDPQTIEWEWVAEMYGRVSQGKPPMTEVEFWELAAWYRRHESEGIHDANINYDLSNTYSGGPHRMGSTKVVMRLRRLRAAHPELADDHPILAPPSMRCAGPCAESAEKTR